LPSTMAGRQIELPIRYGFRFDSKGHQGIAGAGPDQQKVLSCVQSLDSQGIGIDSRKNGLTMGIPPGYAEIPGFGIQALDHGFLCPGTGIEFSLEPGWGDEFDVKWLLYVLAPAIVVPDLVDRGLPDAAAGTRVAIG